MNPVKSLASLRLSLLLLTLTASGCATVSKPSLPPPAIKPVEIPPLPPEALAPKVPQLCSPTCLLGLTRERKNWLNTLTDSPPPATPASGPIKP